MTINKKTAEKNARANVMKIADSPTNLPITPARPNNITAACNNFFVFHFVTPVITYDNYLKYF